MHAVAFESPDVTTYNSGVVGLQDIKLHTKDLLTPGKGSAAASH
jgi:hypothetical protein